MKNIFSRAILFIKENPSITYSLVLVVLIPAAFFFNTYTINSSYEKNIDKITQRKSVLVENIINKLIQNQINEKGMLQASIGQIMQGNEEIVALSVMRKQDQGDNFEILASNNPELVGQIQNDSIQNTQNSLAWVNPEGIAFLDQNENGRFWNVTKSLSDETGKKIGLIAVAFSLKDSDALINRTILNSYWILALTVLIVVLFVSNQARLFGYALTVSKLKEIDKMKDMFISMASHELRSPLTAIKGYIDLLKEKKEITADAESDHFIGNISISVDRLQNLVNDILEVSRLEGNSLPIEITTFNPSPIISQSLEEMRSKALEKGLELKYKSSENPVAIEADINRFKQVLINLISNSIKYTIKGSIEVSTSVKSGKLLITVADTGIGISSEEQANLFHKFYRIQNENTKNVTGTGLGLWITFEIMKRMKGKITVESIEGVGSHFTIHLPIAKK